MSRELASLDDSDLNGINNLSSSELQKKIESLSNVIPEVEEPQTEEDNNNNNNDNNFIAEEEDDNDSEESNAVDENDTVKKPETNKELELLREQNKQLMSLLVQNQTKQKQLPKEEIKKLTKDELLEKFTEDPQGFIEQFINPLKQENIKLQERQIRAQARSINPDFARLESAIDKIIELRPNLASDAAPAERLEIYYTLAKGIEARDKHLREQRKNLTEQEKRTEAKKKAASLPKSTKKVDNTPKKSIDDMTSSELAKYISSLGV